MRRIATIAALVAVSTLACKETTAGAPAQTDDDWTTRVLVTGTARPGDDGEARIVLAGTDGWYVNRAYPGTRIELAAPATVTLSKQEFGKDEITFEGLEGDDKAKRAVFTVPLQAPASAEPLQGTYKMVVCSPDTCSEPFTGSFQVPFEAAKE